MRRKSIAMVLLAGLLGLILSGITFNQAGTQVYAAPASTGGAGSPSSNSGMLDKIKPMPLGANVSVRLTDVKMFPQVNGSNALFYTLTYTNSSGSGTSLLRYFSKVVLPSGAVIKGKPVTASDAKRNLTSKTSVAVTYYVNAGKVAAEKGLSIQIFGWNFNTAAFEKRIGTFTIPSSYTPYVPKGESRKILMDSSPVIGRAEGVQLYKYKSKVYAKAGLSLTNLGTEALTDPGYVYYLKSPGGSMFTLALDDASAGYKILPREKTIIYFMTEIPPGVNTGAFALQIAKSVEEQKLTLPVAFFNLPAAVDTDFKVANYAVKKIDLGSAVVEMQLQKSEVRAEGDSGVWSYQLRVKNTGSQSVTMPDYEVSVMSSEGYSFPLKTSAFTKLTLKPLEEKLLSLHASIPLNLLQNKLQLQVIAPSGDSAAKPALPVAFFAIPYAPAADLYPDSERFIYNDYGAFGIRMTSLQRLPWGDKDLVTVRLKIRNTGASTVALPEFQGILKADQHNLMSSTQVFMDDNSTALAPGESADVTVMASLPYNLPFNQVQTNLLTTDKENPVQFLSLSTTSSTLSTLKPAAPGESIALGSSSRKAEVSEYLTTMYKGTGSNLIYSEVVMKNVEARQVNPSRLYAYFKTGDGQYFKANSNQPEASMGPGGQTMITFWSKIPAAVDASDLQLYVGEGTARGKLVEAGSEATGYIHVAAMTLNQKTLPSQHNLGSGLVTFPYSLFVTSARGTWVKESDAIQMNFTYTLSKDLTFDLGKDEHKLIMQFTDPYGQSVEKALAYGSDLNEGGTGTYSASYSSNLYKSLSGGSFRLTFFDEFQGLRRELGSQAYTLEILRPDPKE